MESARDQAVGTEHTWDRARDTAGRRSAANVRRSSRNSSSALHTSPGRRARRAAASFARPCCPPAQIAAVQRPRQQPANPTAPAPRPSTISSGRTRFQTLSRRANMAGWAGREMPSFDVTCVSASGPPASLFFRRSSRARRRRRRRRRVDRDDSAPDTRRPWRYSMTEARRSRSARPCRRPRAPMPRGVGGEPAPHKTPTSALIAGRPTVIHLYNGG